MNNFKDYYYRSYTVKAWSFEHFFCIFIYFLIFALPFYFSFSRTNFWFKHSFDLVELDYSFTGLYAFEIKTLENGSNTILQYSNIPGSDMVSLDQFTFDIDDNPKNTTISLSFQGFGTNSIESINGIFYYDVKIPTFDLIISTGFTFTGSGDIIQSTVAGKMALNDGSPINALTQTQSRTINKFAYFTQSMKAPSSYSEIVDTHIKNPYNLIISSIQKNSYNTNNADSPRTIKIELQKDTSLVLPYYAPILQTLKFNFSLYVGFLILSYLILKNFMVILIKEEGLQCHVKDQCPPTK